MKKSCNIFALFYIPNKIAGFVFCCVLYLKQAPESGGCATGDRGHKADWVTVLRYMRSRQKLVQSVTVKSFDF